ncbi:MAG: phenylalanine--tRNA ligase subunit beta [Acidobacteria bacterium]|nr:phenylalanine--tRNA ligase subunit beta [Acidobacteriota bacterium]
MLFNIDWLKDYVDIDISSEELAARLTMIGHEVDELKHENGFDILDIDMTPNRGDCSSHIGLARDIAVMLGKEIKIPDTSFKEDKEKSSDYLTVEIDNPEMVHRFAAKVILDAKIGPTPDWMKKRLESIGLRSVCNIVDITNYVMFETGQPLHGYDLDLLAGKKLIGRAAKKGEKVTTLDSIERKLDTEDIVIADGEKGVGLGGVMGGENTELSNSTKKIAVEGAWFNPVNIRRTSKKLGLSTDASYRMERTLDINASVFALERCCNLISEIAGGRILKEMIDIYPNKHDEKIISFRPERARKLIGIEIPDEKISEILESLGGTVTGAGQYRWKVQVPTFRNDLEKEVDLVEEIARFYGYNNITPALPAFEQGAKDLSPGRKIETKTQDYMVTAGLQQLTNFSFCSVAQNILFGIAESESVKVLNPIAEEMDYLRGSLLPSMLKTAALNYNYGMTDIGLFETGVRFKKVQGQELPDEKMMLGIVLSGNQNKLHWSDKPRKFDFYSLSGIVQNMPVLRNRKDFKIVAAQKSFYEEGISAEIKAGNKTVGHLGKISSEAASAFDIEFPVFAAEIELTTLAGIGPDAFNFQSISRFQSVYRDIALIMDENILYEDLISAVKSLNILPLRVIKIFDLFKGKKIPEGKKSIALRLEFLDSEKNFTGSEINELVDTIVDKLKKEFSVELQAS